MKTGKRGAALVSVLLMLALAGCSAGGSKYPVMEAVDTAGMALATVQDDTVKFAYPEEEWTQVESIGPLTVAYTASLAEESVCNLNVQLSQAYEGELTEKDRKDLMAALEDYAGYIKVTVSELRTLNDETVIYMEATTQFTQEYLDLLMEQGVLTEEYIEAVGGRETFLNIPATDQVMMYAVVDGGLFTYTGTYYSDAQKEALLDVLTVVIPNTERVK